MRTSTILHSFAAPLAITLIACGGGELNGHTTPTGSGGYNSGTITPTGSGSGSGANVGTGGTTTSSTTPPPPPCANDDSLKRCDHVFTYADKGESTVEVHGDFDGWGPGVPMTKSGSTWSATAKIPYNKPVLYKFVLNGTSWIPDPDPGVTQIDDGYGGKNSQLAGETCDPYTCATPTGLDDWKSQVLYFAFVDRFYDGDSSNNGAAVSNVETPANYQGGDWAGLMDKLPYLTDLGVTAIWITVPMDNPDASGKATDANDSHLYSGYHGYWPSDLSATEGRFGTMQELKDLVDAAHAANIKIILDYAMNHVHIASKTYTDHPDWFWPVDLNGQSCICGSSACGWDGSNAKRCWFTDYLPDFNFTNDQARKSSIDNVIWWLQQTGADGLRLDAVKHIELSWLTDLRARVKTDIEAITNQHVYMVGETFTGDAGLINSFVNPNTMLDGQFDFPMRLKLVDNVLLRHGSMKDLEGQMNYDDALFAAGLMSTFVGNHDVPRSIHFADDLWTDPWAGGKDKNWWGQPGLPTNSAAFERLANAFAILMTSKGVPLIYYGDEWGMPGAGDPDNRRMMQWSNYSQPQQALNAKVKKLVALRKAHKALWDGARATLSITNDTWAYKMTSGSDVVFVVVNRSDSSKQVDNLPGGALTDQLNGGTVTGPSVQVPARTSMVLTQ